MGIEVNRNLILLLYQARLRAESALVEAQARESDLMFEVDKLRTAKRGLEAKAAQATAAAAKFGRDAEGMLRQGEEVGGCTVGGLNLAVSVLQRQGGRGGMLTLIVRWRLGL